MSHEGQGSASSRRTGGLHVIIFSKDRAFQLQECLRALLHFVLPSSPPSSSPPVRITVLYTTTPASPYEESYTKVRSRFPTVQFVPEEEGGFYRQLLAIVGQGHEGDFVQWLVDDLLFYRSWDVRKAMELLKEDSRIFCYHPKLHPGITYSHTQDKAMVPAVLQWHPLLGQDGFIFDRSTSTLDWNYPWDLCGSLYRWADTRRVLEGIGEKASHPNRLEVLGNKWLARKPPSSTITLPSLCACSSRPILSVVTINRVQEVYSTPVYHHDELAGDLAALDSYLGEGRRMDWEAHAREVFPCVHIGLLATTTVMDGTVPPPDPVSVVIPVRNGVRFIQDSITSVLKQVGVIVEVVVVDDASEDGTVPLVEAMAGEDPRIRLIRLSEHGGIARALNLGVSAASHDLIARLDADDLCLPQRLHEQATYLSSHPGCVLVGGTVLTFSTNKEGEDVDAVPTAITSVKVHPCDSAFLPWALFFSCCIAHPSVMFRRSPVVQALHGDGGGGESSVAIPEIYRPLDAPAEDYALWLRLSSSLPLGSFHNLPQPLLFLRRHQTNTSLVHRQDQIQASDMAASAAISALLGRQIGGQQVSLLRCPTSVSGASVEEMGDAMDLLMEMERCYLRRLQESGSWVEGRAMVVEDVNGRLKEMAAVAVASHGPAAMGLLMKWSGRRETVMPRHFMPKRATAK